MDNAGARVQRLRAVRAEHRRIGLVPRHRLLRYRMVAATACHSGLRLSRLRNRRSGKRMRSHVRSKHSSERARTCTRYAHAHPMHARKHPCTCTHVYG